jgi:hypothetical protein
VRTNLTFEAATAHYATTAVGIRLHFYNPISGEWVRSKWADFSRHLFRSKDNCKAAFYKNSVADVFKVPRPIYFSYFSQPWSNFNTQSDFFASATPRIQTTTKAQDEAKKRKAKADAEADALFKQKAADRVTREAYKAELIAADKRNANYTTPVAETTSKKRKYTRKKARAPSPPPFQDSAAASSRKVVRNKEAADLMHAQLTQKDDNAVLLESLQQQVLEMKRVNAELLAERAKPLPPPCWQQSTMNVEEASSTTSSIHRDYHEMQHHQDQHRPLLPNSGPTAYYGHPPPMSHMGSQPQMNMPSATAASSGYWVGGHQQPTAQQPTASSGYWVGGHQQPAAKQPAAQQPTWENVALFVEAQQSKNESEDLRKKCERLEQSMRKKEDSAALRFFLQNQNK